MSEEEKRTIRIEHFLNELMFLSKKYNLYIESCESCEGPYIVDNKTGEIIASDIDYDLEEKHYTALGTLKYKGFYSSD